MSPDKNDDSRRMRLVTTDEELVDLDVLVTDDQFRRLVRVADRSHEETVTDVVRRFIAEGLAREP